jgi:hypothetical protein
MGEIQPDDETRTSNRLPLPWMFPSTERGAKVLLIAVLLVILEGFLYLLIYGVNLGRIGRVIVE